MIKAGNQFQGFVYTGNTIINAGNEMRMQVNNYGIFRRRLFFLLPNKLSKNPAMSANK
jgi:hypothetical protein